MIYREKTVADLTKPASIADNETRQRTHTYTHTHIRRKILNIPAQLIITETFIYSKSIFKKKIIIRLPKFNEIKDGS
ncbi:Uncharacterized protein APZ42_016595 [Daphnia magna]|uniref:Uncharacterized protein n=1 Tax=Daphnia magna TaxID=35525 RepID=A0A165AI45_9CRUS|nr:Uncharacterized protein APZ42_016595 [Daphnia magna]